MDNVVPTYTYHSPASCTNGTLPFTPRPRRGRTSHRGRYVSDVVVDAPWVITGDMIHQLGIDLVVQGGQSDTPTSNAPTIHQDYDVPKELGIFKKIESKNTMTVSTIVQRIELNRKRLAEKFQRKNAAEKKFYEEKRKQAGESPKLGAGKSKKVV